MGNRKRERDSDSVFFLVLNLLTINRKHSSSHRAKQQYFSTKNLILNFIATHTSDHIKFKICKMKKKKNLTKNRKKIENWNSLRGSSLFIK